MGIEEIKKNARPATPCSAKWDEMEGDEKARYCAQCRLSVYNLEEMNEEELLKAMLKAAAGDQVCIRMYRRADNKVMTRDCPVGLKQIRKRAQQVAAWVSGAVALCLSLALPSKAGEAKVGEKDPSAASKEHWQGTVTTTENVAAKQVDTKSSTAKKDDDDDSYRMGRPPELLGGADWGRISLFPTLKERAARINKMVQKDGGFNTNAAAEFASLMREFSTEDRIRSAECYDIANELCYLAVRIYESRGKLEDALKICDERVHIEESSPRPIPSSVKYWQSWANRLRRLIENQRNGKITSPAAPNGANEKAKQ